MKKTVLGTMLLASLAGISTVTQADVFAAENFSASVALSSNYLFRGLSLSDDQPEISGSFDWGYNGFYAGIWGSSLKPVETESMEIDYYAGYVGEVGGFTYSLDFLYYDYPGQASAGEASDIGDLDYIEYGGSLAYTFGGDYAPTVGISILHSPDFYAETGSATAYEATFGLSLPMDFGLGMHYGVQDLDAKQQPVSSYDYYGIDLTKSVAGFDLTVGYSDTDSDGKTLQNSGDTSEIYFSIAKSL